MTHEMLVLRIKSSVAVGRILLVCVFLWNLSALQADEVIPTIERALPYLEQGGESWIEERGCVSCHRVTFMIWTHQEADARGIDVSRDKLNTWTNWALVNMLAAEEDGGGVDSMSQLLLGRDRKSSWRRKPPRHFKTVDPYETLFKYLLDRQADDGSWPPEGQLSTPPELTTGWALLALTSRDQSPDDPGSNLNPQKDMAPPLEEQHSSIQERLVGSRGRALAYLDSVTPHETHESLILRMARQEPASQDRMTELVGQVLSRQNPDGGWSNRFDQAQSDAYATGQTLYALSLLGAKVDPDKILKAHQFLIETQRPDGSWLVPADRVRVGKTSESLDEIFSYWGSGWATIGLLRSLDEVVKNE